MKKTLVLPLLVLATGCQTIHFYRPSVRPGPTDSQWRHQSVFGLVELQPPLDLSKACDGEDWAEVTMVDSAATVLAPAAASAAIAAVGVPLNVGVLWDPELLEWQCAKGERKSKSVR